MQKSAMTLSRVSAILSARCLAVATAFFDFSPSAARATEIEFKPGVVIEVDGDVEDSFLENGDLLLQWKSGTGSLTLPGYAKAWILEVGGGGAGGSGNAGSMSRGSAGGGGAGGFVENKGYQPSTYQAIIDAGGSRFAV